MACFIFYTGRESRISVLQLSDLPLTEVIDRTLVKKHTIDRSKGMLSPQDHVQQLI